jgi:hypothetical protein
VEYGLNGTKSLLQQYNKTTVDGLRELTAPDIQWTNLTMSDNFFPGYFMDADVLPARPDEMFATGELSVDAMIVGHTSKVWHNA